MGGRIKSESPAEFIGIRKHGNLQKSNMKVWLINTPEATPIDCGKVRLRRSGLFAKMLVERNHEVLWWSSTFFHADKTYRFDKETTIQISNNYKIRFIKSPGYKKNVSFSRLWDHYIVAKHFIESAKQEKKPDIILCSFPTIDLSLAAVKYGKENKVPVVLDIRDLWPDAMIELVPKYFQSIAKIFLLPYSQMAKNACKGATSIIGHVPAFVKWGVFKADRNLGLYDRYFPFAYEEPIITKERREEATAFWKSLGIHNDGGKPIICFFGMIGRQFDLDTVLEAAIQILKQRDALFVFCGDGERRKILIEKIGNRDGIIFPGWVDAIKIWTLMEISSIAITPYIKNKMYQETLSNKAIEYMAGGLPILHSLSEGFLADLLKEYNCGTTYGGNVELLTRIIIELLNSSDRLTLMGYNARELYEKNFRAKKVYNQMVDYLEKVTSDFHREFKI